MKRFASFLIAAVMALPSLPAHAASRIGNVYYEDLFEIKNCVTVTFCVAPSSNPTPSDSYTRVKQVYCYVTANGAPVSTASLEVWSAPPNSPGANILKLVPISISPGVPSSTNNHFFTYSFNDDVLFVVGVNRYIAVEIGLAEFGSPSVRCAVTGDMLPLQ
ncbi:MAG: hypothetical protein JOZ16_14805 [Methylobacteriaceae bacterium]|nr:hypothetical protein [Methylobacteriaceae bacterium]